jgi:peptidoglycan/LPS O-acetylase OafA/YrhL
VIAVTIALTIVSVVIMWMLYEPGGGRSRVYRGTDARAQALLVGAALALILQWRGGPRELWSRIGTELAGIAGGVLFLLAIVRTSERSHYFLYRGGFLLVAMASAAVILAAIQPGSPIVRPILSLPPLRWLGLISYGVYLYHLPIDVWLSEDRVGMSGLSLFVFRTAVTIAIATASYYFVEMPIRHGALSGRRARVALAGSFALVAAALLVSTTGAERGPPRQGGGEASAACSLEARCSP